MSKYVLTHRVGLMGNPSDGFNGKTIAMSISNFWAEVTLVESQTLVKQTHTHTFLNAHSYGKSFRDMLCLSHVNFCDLAGFSPSSTQ